MICPNKVVDFNNSILSKLPSILYSLLQSPKSLSSLYKSLEDVFEDVGQFIIALDVLYVLNVINLNTTNGEVSYVNANIL